MKCDIEFAYKLKKSAKKNVFHEYKLKCLIINLRKIEKMFPPFACVIFTNKRYYNQYKSCNAEK